MSALPDTIKISFSSSFVASRFSDFTSSSNFNAFAPWVIIELLGFENVKDCAEPLLAKSEYPVFLFCILCTILITD